MKDFQFSSTETSLFPIPTRPRRQRSLLYHRGGKRFLDLLLATLLLPLFALIIMALWGATRCDGGPGFYAQKRIGRDGRVFTFWKIRTMVRNADQRLRELCDSDPEIAREWHENQKLARDPRITAIGRILRATSLDELPQIWNVIRGDMSFVGPRPFMTSQEPLYRQAGGDAYFDLRPGITGPWQVDGRGLTPFAGRVRYDEDYGASLSLREDLRLIGKTVAVLLQRTGQ